MPKLFISYAHEDIESARRLYEELSSVPSAIPWFDKESLLAGMRWEPAIRKAIRESEFFLALLSKSSTSKKGYVNREMKMALEILEEFPEDQIYLIPIRLEDCRPSFEALREIHYIDFFPFWHDGFQRLLRAIAVDSQDSIDRQVSVSAAYEYRCALVDLDNGIKNLPQLCQRLNSIQQFFHFTCPPVHFPRPVVHVINGHKYLLVPSMPKSLYQQRLLLNVDLVTGVTRYPLAFGDLYNCFAGPSPEDETFMFISTDLLHRFSKNAKRSFEKGIVYIVFSQLIGYFTNLGYHEETRGCIMDFCENRADMIKGLTRMTLCEKCLGSIKNRRLELAVNAVLADEMTL